VIETDAHATADGVLVFLHDEGVERTTDDSGRVGSMTLAELKRLDAAYRFSLSGG
jgi:glycerophosphoryl diester phosphodiesterase